MPLKPSYLLLAGAGGIVAYSGFKGLGLGSAFRQVIGGQSPAGAQTANQIQTASYISYGYGAGGGGTSGANSPVAAPPGPGGTSKQGRGGQANTTFTGGTAATLSAAAAKSLGFAMVVAAGWGSQWSAFNNIVMAESGWQTRINNGGFIGPPQPGKAYGIPQALPADKMASAGSDWATSSRTQIKWMIGYIRSVYGDPNNAWAFHLAKGWY